MSDDEYALKNPHDATAHEEHSFLIEKEPLYDEIIAQDLVVPHLLRPTSSTLHKKPYIWQGYSQPKSQTGSILLSH